MINNEIIQSMRDAIQDGNINFLIGSGVSTPYFPTLGNIEDLLSALEKESSIDENKKKIIRVSLYKKYFDEVIVKNIDILESSTSSRVVASHYENFIKCLNKILLARKSTILTKQINLFTTNIDLFLEKGLEDTNVEYNDGFSGRFNPVFNLSNFKKSAIKKSLHYDNTSEIPMFNLFKMHGSLVWKSGDKDEIGFSHQLNLVKELKGIQIPSASIIQNITDQTSLAELIQSVASINADPAIDKFWECYNKLCIVNPTKEKFQMTLLNRNYYEILRMYSNELEKENTVLFALGFSFADEHIREITLRALNSNPTLIVYIIGRKFSSIDRFAKKFNHFKQIKFDNLKIIAPPPKEQSEEAGTPEVELDFKEMCEHVFSKILKKIDASAQPISEGAAPSRQD